MRRNVAGQFVGAQLISKTDGSAVTTGTTTVYVTGDAGTQAAGSVGSGACTHEGNGYWSYAPAQAETNYTQVAFTFVNTSACNVTVQIFTLAYDASGQMTGVGLNATQTGVTIPTVTTVTNQLTAAQIATGVWQDTTAGDFTVASSIGKSLYTTGNAPGAASGLALVGSNMGSVSSVTAGVTVTTNNDKTGYSLTQTFPTNFSSLAITVGGAVTAGTVSDKTGYTVSTVSDKTGYSIATGGIISGANAAAELNTIADAILDRVLSAGTDSGADNASSRTVRQALRALRNKVAIATGTMTVYKENDITASWTSAIATTAGNPISSSDPT